MSKAPKTMDAALAIAAQYEHLHAHARPIVDVNAMSFRNRDNQGSSSGSRRFNTNPPSSDKPTCSYCHKRGHHINDCFSLQKATNSSQSNSNSHSNKSHTSRFSRRPGSSHNPTNHTPHNSGSSDASLSKRKVRVCIAFRQIILINCYVFMVLSLMGSCKLDVILNTE
jgi:hypothetical protein